MDKFSKIDHPFDLVLYLSEIANPKINAKNYVDYLKFNFRKQRKGMAETLAIECYTLTYLANQIAKHDPISQVILADGKRRSLDTILYSESKKPAAVFITSMSSNFPTTVATSIPLNHAGIPVIIGGIHVSTSPNDVQTFIKKYVPFPELVAQVKGPADSKVIAEIINDLSSGGLKPEYIGNISLENGVWGNDNIGYMEPLKLYNLYRIPFIGKMLVKKIRVNAATPYMGCPFSCSFCSISTISKNQRKFAIRDPEDFIAELEDYQKDGVNSRNRFFFFLPDNLSLGGGKLEDILDRIIYSDLKINFAAQISIDIANDSNLLKKMRLSGATHFFLGLETLDIRNLEYIGKHILRDIKTKGISVKEYYREQIKKIQSYGISVHGSFIFGLPFDHFNSFNDHTGLEISEFCIENYIGLQPCSLTDLPGSFNFERSQKSGDYLYGKQGSMDYLVGLCLSDLTEINRIPFDSLHKSPLLIFFIAYQAIQRVGATKIALINAIHSMAKAFMYPTKNGLLSIRERVLDSLWALASQLAISQYKDHGEMIAYSKNGVTGSFERLFQLEKNSKIKKIMKNYVEQFK